MRRLAIWASVSCGVLVAFGQSNADHLEGVPPCLACQISEDPGLSADVVDLAEKVTDVGNTCREKSLLFDPARKSIFQKFNIAYHGKNESIQKTEDGLACIYGLGDGVISSLKDLVMLVPDLIDFSFTAAKATGKGIAEIWSGEAIENLKMWSRQAGNSVANAYTASREGVENALASASFEVAEAYKQGGAFGAISSIGLEIAETSPHKVVGNFITEIFNKIEPIVSREITGFTCMSQEARDEMICKVVSYVALDVLTGKIVWGKLAKSPKLIAGIQKVKSGFMRAPMTARWLERNLAKISDADNKKLENLQWKIDEKLRIEGEQVEVAASDGKIYVRGVDPTTGKLAYFEAKPSLSAQIEARLKESEHSRGNAHQQDLDPFVPNSGLARSNPEFVQEVNQIAGNRVEQKQALAISSGLTDVVYAKEYGLFLKSAADAKESAARSDIRALVEQVNHSIVSLKTQKLNLSAIAREIDLAKKSGNSNALKIYKEALKKIEDGSGENEWVSAIRKRNASASNDEVKKAARCVFDSAQ